MSDTPDTRRQRRNRSQDLLGKLMTQTGPRTTAPLWVRPLLTVGEWAVYTALWSYPTDAVFPTHQDLADRAWCERGTAADAVAKFDDLGLLKRERQYRDDGSDTSNDYYLVEVCTPELARLVAVKQAERAAEQEKKRKARKAKNRSYAAKTPRRDGGVEVPQRGYGAERTPVKPDTDGGTAQAVPPGYGTGSTSGGTVHAVPGYGMDRTHESLGLTEVVKGTVRTTSSSSADTAAEPEEEDPVSSESENQEIEETKESVLNPTVFPTLTEWEASLVDECLPIAGARWSKSAVVKVLGSRKIREITARDPEVVRRAFLIGAANRQGVTLPIRMWYVGECPHWRRAESELAAERTPAPPAAEPAPPPRPPRQRPVDEDPAGGQPALPPPTSPPASVTAFLAERGIRAGAARESAGAA